MHILVLTDEIYPDAIGGVGKSVFNECAAWVRAGQHVTVLVRCLRADLGDRDEVEGITIIRLRGPVRGKWAYRLYLLSIVYQVWRRLRQFSASYDVIYAHSALYILPAVLAGADQYVPIVFNCHAPIAVEILIGAQHNKYGRLGFLAQGVARLFGLLERWALGRASQVVLHSTFMRSELQRSHHLDRLGGVIIPLGIDPARYTPYPKHEARLQLGLPAGRPILLTVRRLEGRMGLTNLIKAIVGVRKRYPEVLLLIAGKGHLRPALEALIERHSLSANVRMLGFVDEAELPIYLAAADLFVLPTEQLEGFGLATIEALAVGVPVIGTPVGATPEILASIDPALITRDSSSAALAETILYWLDRPTDLAALSTRCRAEVEIRYNINEVAKQLIEVFEQAIATHQAARERAHG